MKYIFFSLLAGCLLMGNSPQDPNPRQLIEVEAQLVADCTKVGVLTETADAASPFPVTSTKRMIQRLKARAVQLGATHLVWLHKTNLAAAAEAYRCPSP